MISPTILPGRGLRVMDLRSRLAFSWRASDLGLVDRATGNEGVFSRASDGGMVLGRGRFRTDDNLVLMGPNADDAPRFEMVLDPVSGIYVPALRLEGSRQNSRTYFGQLDNAAWTKARASVVPNVAVAPDGVVSMDKLVEDGTVGNSHYVLTSITGATDSTDQVFSIVAKAGERTFVALRSEDKGGVLKTTWFNLTTGAIGTQGHTVARIGPEGDGYRCEVVFDSGVAGVASIHCYTHLAVVDGTLNYNGDGASGLYLWGGQFEIDQSFASTLIPTEASAITRAAEGLYWDYLMKPRAMTMYVKFIERGTVELTSAATVLHIGKGDGSTPYLALANNNAGKYRAKFSGAVESIMGVAPSIGDGVELLLTLTDLGKVQIIQAINGGAGVSGAVSVANALSSSWSEGLVHLNSVGSSAIGFNSHREVKVAEDVRSMEFMREVV